MFWITNLIGLALSSVLVLSVHGLPTSVLLDEKSVAVKAGEFKY